jgi:probable HAF family extracellular repeat protein
LAAQAAPKPQWTVVDLGPSFNPVFGGVVAVALNDQGQVTGWSYSGTNYSAPVHHAFIWENGAITDTGVVPGTTDSAAWGINSKGTLAGSSSFQSQAAIYRDGAWTALGVDGVATDINDHDTIVGTYRIPGVAEHPYMIRNGAFVDMGSLGGTLATAMAVNNKNVAVGYSYLAGSVTIHAFVYEDDAMKDIGTLGGTQSYAYDVNDHGVAVGGSLDALGHMAAFTYDGVMQRIPGLGNYSYARSINDHGDVIGYSDGHTFLYSDGNVTLLDQQPDVVASGWHISNATGINNRGWVVATGYRFDAQGRYYGGSILLIPK